MNEPEYTITRRFVAVLWFWTGCKWSHRRADAKLFKTRKAAEREVKRCGIIYKCNIARW